MNERIKLLAKTYLSHERFGPDGESTIEDYYEFYPEELEYFVELIVRECVDVIDDTHQRQGINIFIIDKIKQHFGVDK